MRYAIVSDIHANLVAWEAVVADLRTQRIDQVICLGDVVGYGPKPAEVLVDGDAATLVRRRETFEGMFADELEADR